jgi:hypothetical protein
VSVVSVLVVAASIWISQVPQPPTFRGGANLVQVDAVVTDKDGRPIADLTAPDFDVQDDGVAMPITVFRLVTVPAAARDLDNPIRNADDEQREAARDDVRVFAIFLDEYGSLVVRTPTRA